MQQLDIFADSLSIQWTNALIVALSRFDRIASRQALQSLAAVDPAHVGLTRFQELCDFLADWPDGCDAPEWPRTAAAVAAAVQSVEQRIVPTAAIMGNARRSLLDKIWLDLGRASEKAGIGHERHHCFSAELYLRAHQFRDVVRMATDVPGADRHAAVQRWLGLGYGGCGELELARAAALRYAWLAPQRFGALLGEMGDAALSRDWRDFQSDLGNLDATWFPAWCAHEKKGGSTVLDNLPPGDGPMAYCVVTGLVMRERAGLCPAVYEDRAKLKRLSESFFAFYLGRRSDPRFRMG